MNKFQDIFDAQKALFASGITRTYEWRVDQLDRMARMIKENEGRFQKAMAKDFKTASQEYIFETGASAGESEVQKSKLKEWMGGQWCTSPGYAYVQESVADAFVAEAKKALLELFGDDPKSNTDYSRIINARTVDRLAALIDPAKVVAGGKSDRDAHYLDPTLLYPITWNDKIMDDEIFGPILPILTYKSFDEAMARMAKTGRPLSQKPVAIPA